MPIDAHQHFWTLGRGDYTWPTPDLTPIYRDFGPDDLAPLLVTAGIDGTIVIQATPTLAETHFLLDLAGGTPFIKGVVGWVDFEAPDVADVIAGLARNPQLKGLRPMIQTIADDRWMLGDALTPAFEAMVGSGLVFDALIQPRHLSVFGQLMARHPDLRAVVDHAAKPDIGGGGFEAWAKDIGTIARETHALCKLSGLWTEGGGHTGPDLYKPYVEHLLASFGPERLLWGSDWPVLRLAGEYADWHAQCRDLTASLTAADRDAIFGGNARRLYGLD